MLSINGIGARFYGKREVDSDGSYIATKWFIFGFLPIIPLGSFRIWPAQAKNYVVYSSKEYRYQKVRLNKRQIFNTYLIWYLPLILFLLLISLVKPSGH